MAIDYMGTFFTDEGFDFTGLLNADFLSQFAFFFAQSTMFQPQSY